MSFGLAICSKCFREVHQDGPRDNHGQRTWAHCEDKTPRCEGAVSRYPDPANGVQVVGRACRADEFPALGIRKGDCEGCYRNPCICLPDDAPCDPE